MMVMMINAIDPLPRKILITYMHRVVNVISGGSCKL